MSNDEKPTILQRVISLIGDVLLIGVLVAIVVLAVKSCSMPLNEELVY